MTPRAWLAAALLLLALPCVAAAQPQDCTAMLTGQGAAPRWQAVADPSAPGGQAMTEATRLAIDERYPLCVLAAPVAADLDVSVGFRAIAGRLDRAAGIAVRLTDAATYYVVRANAAENNVRLYHVTGGRRVQFAGRDRVPVTTGTWHTLRLRVQANRFAVYLDGQHLFDAEDSRIAAPGRVALWTKADSATHFTAPVIQVLP